MKDNCFLHVSLRTLTVFFVIAATLVLVSCQLSDDGDEGDTSQGFKISFTDRMNGQFYNEVITGQNVTLTMNANSSDMVEYERYRIDFTGDTAALPETVSVTITWDPVDATVFRWGGSGKSDQGTVTFAVPRSGGTIGISGSIHNSLGTFQPSITSTAGTAGTVKFEAEGVYTMNCTVVR